MIEKINNKEYLLFYHSNQDNDVLRPRELLVHKKELREIMAKRKKGLSLIPSKVLSDGIRIVVEIALVKFKTKYDRRETIKRRESDREMARIVKSYQ